MENEIHHAAPIGTNDRPTEHLRLSSEEPTPVPQGLPTELVLRALEHADNNTLAQLARTNSTYHKEATKRLYENLVFRNKGMHGSFRNVQSALDGLDKFCATYYGEGVPRPANLSPSVEANLWSWINFRPSIYQATQDGEQPELSRYFDSIVSLTISMPSPGTTYYHYSDQMAIFLPEMMAMPLTLEHLCLKRSDTRAFDRSDSSSLHTSADDLRMFPTSVSSLKLPQVVWLAEDGSLWPNTAPSPTHLEVLEVTTSARWGCGGMASGTIDQVFGLSQLRGLALGGSWKTRGLGLGRLLTLPMLEVLALGIFNIGNTSPDAVEHSNDLEEILGGSHARLRMLTITIRVGTGEATQAQISLVARLGQLAEDKDRWPSLDGVEVKMVGENDEVDEDEESEYEAEEDEASEAGLNASEYYDDSEGDDKNQLLEGLM